jgi:hypothetical protein
VADPSRRRSIGIPGHDVVAKTSLAQNGDAITEPHGDIGP